MDINAFKLCDINWCTVRVGRQHHLAGAERQDKVGLYLAPREALVRFAIVGVLDSDHVRAVDQVLAALDDPDVAVLRRAIHQV